MINIIGIQEKMRDVAYQNVDLRIPLILYRDDKQQEYQSSERTEQTIAETLKY